MHDKWRRGWWCNTHCRNDVRCDGGNRRLLLLLLLLEELNCCLGDSERKLNCRNYLLLLCCGFNLQDGGT